MIADPPLRRPAPHVRSWAWLAFAVVELVATTAFFVVPNGLWRAACMLLVNVLAVLAVLAGVALHRPERRHAWVVLAAAQAFGAAAGASVFLVPALTGVMPPAGVSDALFLLSACCMVVGLALWVRRQDRDPLAVIDTAVFTLGLGVLSWVFVISPYADTTQLDATGRAVVMTNLVANVLLLGTAAHVAFVAGRSTTGRLLIAWAVAQLAGDTIFSVQSLQGTFEMGGPVFATWLLSFGLIGTAALHPSVAARSAAPELVDGGTPERRPRAVSPLRLGVLVASAVPLPALLVVRAVQESPADVPVVAVGSIVATVLVLTRFVLATPPTVSPAVRRALQRSTVRVVVVFVFLAFVPLSALTYLGIHQAELTLRDEVRGRMATVSEVSATYLREQVDGIEALVVSYADRPNLVAALSSRDRGPAQVQKHLASLQSAHPALFSAWMLDTHGRLDAIAPLAPEVVGQDYSHRDYFRGVALEGRPYVSSAFVAARFGHPRAVGVAAPVRDDDGQILGYLVVGYHLDGIRAFSARLAAAQGVDLTVTDQSGIVLAGRGSALSGMPSAANDPRIAAALRGETGTRSFDTAKGPSLSSYRRVPSLDWAVLAETPESVAFAAQRQLASRIVVVALLLGQVLLVGLVAAVRNERRRREAETHLADREDHLRGVLEAAGDAFVAVDAAGRVIEWNARAVTTFGYSREEALGALLVELVIPPHQLEDYRRDMARLHGGTAGEQLGERVEVTMRRADGTEFPGEITRWATPSAGQLTFSAFVRDVTERKEYEAELAAARDAALEASRLKSEFVANMSHEIRTPMNGVLGMTSLLLDTDLTGVQRDYAETVGNSAEGLLTVINDILDFSKIEAGKLDLEEADFLLRPVVEDVVGLLAAAAQAKGLEITALVDPDVPTAVRGDQHRLRQVLTNLVGNAVKFTRKGEVFVRVSTVSADDASAPTVRFAVRDTGIGIPEAQRERLFQAFSQADTSTTRQYGGTGLGLTISRQLVELMGGKLDFTSSEGAGTTFWVDLRMTAVSSPPVGSPGQARAAGARVLVVDDNETNRRVLQRYLTAWSLDAHCVADGQAALAALRSAAADGEPFDGVILDMNMPGMTGVEVAQAVVADPVLAATPMAVLTSSSAVGEAERARQAGVTVYLAKPVREAALYEGVSRLLGKDPAERRRTVPAVPRPRSGHRVLVVEDNAVNQQVVVAMLETLGHEADVAVDGQHALELFWAGDYAAVLMDCQMPRMDGYAATRLLRQGGGRGTEVPVIALTASALAEDEQRCRDAGMNDFMTKPLRPETLGQVLERWLPGAGPVVDPLDREYLAQLQTVGPALLGGIVSTFLDGVPDRVAALRAAVEERDDREVSRLAHTLRGSAAYVAAPALADLCGRLEAAGASDPAAMAVLLAEVEAELDRVGRELRVVAENAHVDGSS